MAAAIPSLLLGTFSICTSAGQCFKVTKEFLEQYGPSLSGLLSTGLAVKEKSFQYGLLAGELKMTIEILGEYDMNLEHLRRIQKEYRVQICALDMAEDVSKKTHSLLENFVDTKVNMALMRKDPEYYRDLLRTGIGYLTAAKVTLDGRSKPVLDAVHSARKIRDPDRRQRVFQELRDTYNMC